MNSRVIANESDAGARLDVFIAAKTGLTRSAAARLIDDGLVTVNGVALSKSYRVEAAREYRIEPPSTQPCDLVPLEYTPDVRYEDDDLIVVVKPRGLVVHPAAGHANDTLVNALIYHCGQSLSGIGGTQRPGIVHRLDKDTAGLMVVAKNDFSHLSLAEQIKKRTASREYDAIICGSFRDDSGMICAPIGRDPKNRKRMAVTTQGSREATTHWSVVARYAGYTHIKCRLETGRTHQIRVHMAYVGHPLCGDTTYGGSDKLRVGGQCLFASRLCFSHPRTGERLEISAELPDYFERVLTILKNKV